MELTRQLNQQLFQRHGIVESTLKQLYGSVSQCLCPQLPFKSDNSIPTGATTKPAFNLGIHGGLGTEQHLDDVHMAQSCCHVQWLTAWVSACPVKAFNHSSELRLTSEVESSRICTILQLCGISATFHSSGTGGHLFNVHHLSKKSMRPNSPL